MQPSRIPRLPDSPSGPYPPARARPIRLGPINLPAPPRLRSGRRRRFTPSGSFRSTSVSINCRRDGTRLPHYAIAITQQQMWRRAPPRRSDTVICGRAPRTFGGAALKNNDKPDAVLFHSLLTAVDGPDPTFLLFATPFFLRADISFSGQFHE